MSDRSYFAIVVEDDHASRVLAKAALEAHGFEVLGTASGEDALLELWQRCPDVVVADLDLPGIDGFILLDVVRRDPACAGVAVVAMSAFVTAFDESDKTIPGFDGVFAKPIETRSFGMRVREIIVRRRAASASSQA